MRQLTYREAEQKDLETLVNMLANDTLGATREDTSKPLNDGYISAFKEIEKDPNNQLIIAELESKIVGMFQITFIPYITHIGSKRCLIEGVRVHEKYRSLGFGEQMIKHAIALAKKQNCKMVQLTSNKTRKGAIKFYEKLGFKATHEGFKLNF